MQILHLIVNQHEYQLDQETLPGASMQFDARVAVVTDPFLFPARDTAWLLLEILLDVKCSLRVALTNLWSFTKNSALRKARQLCGILQQVLIRGCDQSPLLYIQQCYTKTSCALDICIRLLRIQGHRWSPTFFGTLSETLLWSRLAPWLRPVFPMLTVWSFNRAGSKWHPSQSREGLRCLLIVGRNTEPMKGHKPLTYLTV